MTEGAPRLVLTITPTGSLAVVCDHCGMEELLPHDRAGAFVRGRVAAHVALIASIYAHEAHRG